MSLSSRPTAQHAKGEEAPISNGTTPQPAKGKEVPEKLNSLMQLLEGSDSVTVKVGEGEAAVAWNLPGALLKHASPFFAAALSGPWPESESKTI
ncbi:MAG: hypothetical protein Q9177_004887 [Variospora cf. flavescens]